MIRRHRDQQVEHLRAALPLQAWTTSELALLAHLADDAVFRAGDTIVERGTIARHVYLILDGTAIVNIGGRHERYEGVLVNDTNVCTRTQTTTTVVAATNVEVLAITPQNFQQLDQHCGTLLRNLATRQPAPHTPTFSPLARRRPRRPAPVAFA